MNFNLRNLILEKFELPAGLEHQLNNTALSALGHILIPQSEKFKKFLFVNKALNDKSYNSLKNVVSTIKKLTEGGGNTKLNFSDVFIPEYYSVTTAKELMRKCKITIEKSGNDIYVESNEKGDKYFQDLVISKDYAGWDLKRLNDFWNHITNDFENYKNQFDDRIVMVGQIQKTLETWKSLDKGRAPTVNPHGGKAVLVYEKVTPNGMKYEHYFYTLQSREEKISNYPDYFYLIDGDAQKPIIVQTVVFDEFDLNKFYSVSSFMKMVGYFIGTARHEGRHLFQHEGNVQKNLNGRLYGGPKNKLRHQYNTDVRGINSSGISSPTSNYKDTTDSWNRVHHANRDVEFKTNLYNYKEEIEEILGKNIPRSQWKEGFRDLILYIIGRLDYTGFNKKFKYGGTSWRLSVAYGHLNALYKQDRPKFNQYIKELYKLIFNR